MSCCCYNVTRGVKISLCATAFYSVSTDSNQQVEGSSPPGIANTIRGLQVIYNPVLFVGFHFLLWNSYEVGIENFIICPSRTTCFQGRKFLDTFLRDNLKVVLPLLWRLLLFLW